jgi:hypothetical protein
MPSNFSTIRREIAAVLVGILDLAAGAGALAVLALVENRIDGISLTALARVAADHLVRDDNVIEAIRAARTLRGDSPEPDLSAPPRRPPGDRATARAPSTRGDG